MDIRRRTVGSKGRSSKFAVLLLLLLSLIRSSTTKNHWQVFFFCEAREAAGRELLQEQPRHQGQRQLQGSSAEPTDTPVPVGAPVTLHPTLAGNPVDVVLADVQITYFNVGPLNALDFRGLETLTETWFNDFFIGTGQSVRNMEASMAIQSQDYDVASNSNMLTFDQQMKYVALEGAEQPAFYLTLPYRNIIANAQLGRLLQSNLTAFVDTAIPIEVPVLPESPNESPSASPVPMVGNPFDVVISDIQITYLEVGPLDALDFRGLETLTETWFNDFFNGGTVGQQRDLGSGNNNLNRNLQRQYVRNMEASMAIQSQDYDATSNANTLTFDQQMKYVALEGAEQPEFYLTLPYRNIVANGQLGRLLRSNLTAFADVAFPIEVPILPASPTDDPMAVYSPAPAMTSAPAFGPFEPTTSMPVDLSPTIPVGPGPVDVVLASNKITYFDVGMLNELDFSSLEALTEEWFNGFYNDGTERRRLQREYVRDMQASIAIQQQEVDSSASSNTLTFDQQMKYVALEGAESPEFYLTLPYRNIVANGQLGRMLRSNITAFSNVAFPIEVPLLSFTTPTTEPPAFTDAPSSSSSSSAQPINATIEAPTTSAGDVPADMTPTPAAVAPTSSPTVNETTTTTAPATASPSAASIFTTMPTGAPVSSSAAPTHLLDKRNVLVGIAAACFVVVSAILERPP